MKTRLVVSPCEEHPVHERGAWPRAAGLDEEAVRLSVEHSLTAALSTTYQGRSVEVSGVTSTVIERDGCRRLLVGAELRLSYGHEQWRGNVDVFEVPLPDSAGMVRVGGGLRHLLASLSTEEGVRARRIDSRTAEVTLTVIGAPTVRMRARSSQEVTLAFGDVEPLNLLDVLAAIVGGARAAEQFLSAACIQVAEGHPVLRALPPSRCVIYVSGHRTARGAMMLHRVAVVTPDRVDGQYPGTWWVPTTRFSVLADCVGRVLAEEIRHPWSGECLAGAGTRVTEWLRSDLAESGVEVVRCVPDDASLCALSVARTLKRARLNPIARSRLSLTAAWRGTLGVDLQSLFPPLGAAGVTGLTLTADGREKLRAIAGGPSTTRREVSVDDLLALALVLLGGWVVDGDAGDVERAGVTVVPASSRVALAIRQAAEEVANRLISTTFRKEWSSDADAIRAAAWVNPFLEKVLAAELTMPVEEREPFPRSCLSSIVRLRPREAASTERLAVRIEDVVKLRGALCPVPSPQLHPSAWATTMARVVSHAQTDEPVVCSGFEEDLLEARGELVRSPVRGSVVGVDFDKVIILPSGGVAEAIGAGSVIVPLPQGAPAGRATSCVRVGGHVNIGDGLLSTDAVVGRCARLGVNARVAYADYYGYTIAGCAVVSQSLAARLVRVAPRYRWLGATRVDGQVVSSGDRYWEPVVDGHCNGADLAHRLTSSPARPPYVSALPELRRFLWAVAEGPGLAAPEQALLESPDVNVLRARGITSYDHTAGSGIEDVRFASPLYRPLAIGDQIVSRHGVPATISAVLPDFDMPIDCEGRPIDLILPPDRGLSAGADGELLEAWLGGIGDLLGVQLVTQGALGAPRMSMLRLLERASYLKAAAERLDLRVRSQASVLLEDVISTMATYASQDWELDRRAEALEEQLLDDIMKVGTQPHMARHGLPRAEVVAALIDRASWGRMWLRDGRSGEMIESPVPAGVLHVMALDDAEPLPRARSTGAIDPQLDQWLYSSAIGEPQYIDDLAVLELSHRGATHVAAEFLGDKDAVDRHRSAEVLFDILSKGRLASFGRRRDAQDLAALLVAVGLEVEVGGGKRLNRLTQGYSANPSAPQ